MDFGAFTATIVMLVIVALAFDFMNGFHDAANSIATVVSTGVLKPYQAVIWAAFFNFVAIAIFELKVAATVGKGIVDPAFVDNHVIFGALIGAISWNVITWYVGLPSSSSHALIGGMIGSTVAKAGTGPLLAPGIIKTSAFIVVAPVMGLILALIFSIAGYWLLRRKTPQGVDKWFRKLQLLSAAAYSLGHGGNDAQKTMGIVAGALYTAGFITKTEMATNWGRYHYWIILAANGAIAAGTYFGGWRIVHTMGSKITKLKPFGGFCAESAGALTLFGTALAGIPVSTTHTITGAIVGVGAVHRLSAVRWGVARRIVWAWILTIPASAVVAGVVFWAIRLFNHGA